MSLLTQLPAWQALSEKAAHIDQFSVATEFVKDTQRFEHFSVQAADLLLDYSKQKINEAVFSSLLDLAQQRKLAKAIEALFAGKIVNTTESLPALHTALRNFSDEAIEFQGQNIVPEIRSCLAKMRLTAEHIAAGQYTGCTGKKIRDVVNIGVGGSDLGPALAYNSLESYNNTGIRAHFISNLDSYHLDSVLKDLDPETTVFIIVSKSFTTQETQLNASLARRWLLNSIANLDDKKIAQHFFAVTAQTSLAVEQGILPDNIFAIWDWVGGRFSIWSAVGLVLAICLGMDCFTAILEGAFAMDQHFREAEFSKNMPVILALLGVWNQNFLGARSHAIIPYDQRLSLLPTYLQQLLMESLGKHITTKCEVVDYTTGVIIWGGTGTNSQHAFHQLFMQGTQWAPIDFILALRATRETNPYHRHLVANCLGQARTLMQGKTIEEGINELQSKGYDEAKALELAPYLVISDACPSNIIVMDSLTPKTLGSLLALYEHMTYVQAVIWDIDPFDQWGVEWGKKLAKEILNYIEKPMNESDYDSSTLGILIRYKTLMSGGEQ